MQSVEVPQWVQVVKGKSGLIVCHGARYMKCVCCGLNLGRILGSVSYAVLHVTSEFLHFIYEVLSVMCSCSCLGGEASKFVAS